MTPLPEGKPSVRTPEAPRAFTPSEFWAGAGLALLFFQPLAALVSLVWGPAAVVFAVYAAMFGIPMSIVAALVGSPPAYLLGRSLRTQSRDAVHLAAFGAYGLVLSWLALHGFAAVSSIGQVVDTSWWQFSVLDLYDVAGAAAVALGWWATSRRALRRDRRAADAEEAMPA
jgi:hypothetical protein